MADRPTITTLASGALYDTDTLNTNFTALRDAFDTLIGRNGTNGANNSVTGDIDFSEVTLRNATLQTPTSTVSTLPNGSAGVPAFSFTDDSNTGMYRLANGIIGFSGSGGIGFAVDGGSATANYLRAEGANVGNNPVLSAQGSSSSIDIVLRAKSDTRGVIFQNGSNDVLATIAGLANAVNYITLTPSIATANVSIDAVGSDTDIDVHINPKGTGGLVVGSATGGGQGTDTVNASNYFIDGTPITGFGLPRSYLAGLGISNNSIDPNKDIDIAVGECRSSDNTEDLTLASVLVKQLDAAWAVGTNAGGLDTGAVAANTWYYVFVIKRTDTDVVDVLFSTNSSSPTMPPNYTKFRRIGAFLTSAGSNIVAFEQIGDKFSFDTPILDFSSAGSATATTVSLTVPALVVEASFNYNSATPYTYFSPLTAVDLAPSETAVPLATHNLPTDPGPGGHGPINIMTNTSGQIRMRNASTVTVYIATLGWVDRRGRDD